jgi:3'-phosphoadenosine 5'-phosphosulfate sulfotransferase
MDAHQNLRVIDVKELLGGSRELGEVLDPVSERLKKSLGPVVGLGRRVRPVGDDVRVAGMSPRS